jgi:hypothetical protein
MKRYLLAIALSTLLISGCTSNGVKSDEEIVAVVKAAMAEVKAEEAAQAKIKLEVEAKAKAAVEAQVRAEADVKAKAKAEAQAIALASSPQWVHNTRAVVKTVIEGPYHVK